MKPFCIAISFFCLLTTTAISRLPDAQPCCVCRVATPQQPQRCGLLECTAFFINSKPALAVAKTKQAGTLTFLKTHARKWAFLKWNAAHLKSGRPVIFPDLYGIVKK